MVPINWLAVIAAVVVRMAVGGLWYSPLLFVRPWQALTGVTPQTMRSGLGKAIALDLVMSLLMAVALATILGLAHVADWLGGKSTRTGQRYLAAYLERENAA